MTLPDLAYLQRELDEAHRAVSASEFKVTKAELALDDARQGVDQAIDNVAAAQRRYDEARELWQAAKDATPDSAPTGAAACELCGLPMPADERMLRFHGFSGPCPLPGVNDVAAHAATADAAGEAMI